MEARTTPLFVSSTETAYLRLCWDSASGLRLAVMADLAGEAEAVYKLARGAQLESWRVHRSDVRSMMNY